MSILVVCYVNLAISLVVSHFSNRREPPETMDKFKASACVEWTVNVATRPLRLMGGYYGGHFTHIALNYETLIPVVWAEICWQEHRDANELNCFLDCQSGLTHNRRQLSLVIKRWAGKQVNFRCSFRPSPLSSRLHHSATWRTSFGINATGRFDWMDEKILRVFLQQTLQLMRIFCRLKRKTTTTSGRSS